MDLVKTMSHVLGFVNHKVLNGTGKGTSHDLHRVNQSTHRWHKERHTNCTRCGQSHSQFSVNTQLKLRGETEEELHSFLNSGLDADVWTATRSGRLEARGQTFLVAM